MSRLDDNDEENSSIREVLAHLNDLVLLQSTYLPDTFRYQDLAREIGELLKWFRLCKIPVTMVYPHTFIAHSHVPTYELTPKRPNSEEIAENLQQMNAIWNTNAPIEKKLPVFLWWSTQAISIPIELNQESQQWRLNTWLEPKISVRNWGNNLLGRLALHLGLAQQLLQHTQSGDHEEQLKLWLEKLNTLEIEISLNGVLP